jgi:hypothetical protein
MNLHHAREEDENGTSLLGLPILDTKAFPSLISASPSLAVRKPYMADGSNSSCKIEQINVSISSKLMILSSTTFRDC